MYQFGNVLFHVSQSASSILIIKNASVVKQSSINCKLNPRPSEKTKEDREKLTFAAAHDGASSAPKISRGFHPEPKPKAS